MALNKLVYPANQESERFEDIVLLSTLWETTNLTLPYAVL